jgi:hypothetical protein
VRNGFPAGNSRLDSGDDEIHEFGEVRRHCVGVRSMKWRKAQLGRLARRRDGFAKSRPAKVPLFAFGGEPTGNAAVARGSFQLSDASPT